MKFANYPFCDLKSDQQKIMIKSVIKEDNNKEEENSNNFYNEE